MLMETGEHPTISRVGPPVDGSECTDEVTGECRWTTESWRRFGISNTEVWSPADLRPDVSEINSRSLLLSGAVHSARQRLLFGQTETMWTSGGLAPNQWKTHCSSTGYRGLDPSKSNKCSVIDSTCIVAREGCMKGDAVHRLWRKESYVRLVDGAHDVILYPPGIGAIRASGGLSPHWDQVFQYESQRNQNNLKLIW
jgi:hypothetical protein